jgi:large subunit ribosomal protein L21
LGILFDYNVLVGRAACSPEVGGTIVFAVVETGGKQYKVAPGDQLDVEYLGVEAGQQFDLGRVLMVGSDGGEVLVGSPLVDGARVVATVVAEHRGDKLIVFKYKAKKRYRRKNGHRQMLTRVSIDDILADGIADSPKQEAEPAPKQTTEATAAPTAEIEAEPIVAAPAEIEGESIVAAPAEVETEQPVAEAAAEQPVAATKPKRTKKAAAAAAPAAEAETEQPAAEAETSAPETIVTATPIVEVKGVPTTDTIGSGLDLQDALNTDVETEEGKA